MNTTQKPIRAPELRVTKWIDEKGNDHTPVTLKNLGQGYKVIYCFQAWCPGCHSSGFPSMKKLVDKLSNKGFSFAAVQTVFEGFSENTVEKTAEMQNRYDLRIPFGHDQTEGGHPTIMEDYRTGGTPWFIVIDPNGNLIFNDFRIDADALIKSVGDQLVEPTA